VPLWSNLAMLGAEPLMTAATAAVLQRQ